VYAWKRKFFNGAITGAIRLEKAGKDFLQVVEQLF